VFGADRTFKFPLVVVTVPVMPVVGGTGVIGGTGVTPRRQLSMPTAVAVAIREKFWSYRALSAGLLINPYSISIAGARVELSTAKFAVFNPRSVNTPRALTLVKTDWAQARAWADAVGLVNISKPCAVGFSAAFL